MCGATGVGERTGGGAHPREGFRVHPHLEATIPVARAISPRTGRNWESTGVVPDIDVPADAAHNTALRHALDHPHQDAWRYCCGWHGTHPAGGTQLAPPTVEAPVCSVAQHVRRVL